MSTELSAETLAKVAKMKERVEAVLRKSDTHRKETFFFVIFFLKKNSPFALTPTTPDNHWSIQLHQLETLEVNFFFPKKKKKKKILNPIKKKKKRTKKMEENLLRLESKGLTEEEKRDKYMEYLMAES
ncbi:hypothetical protein RFI_07574 [Reticulomyxa filosa]|uniref:Uncharacterized protein n=1 Tax=Reticulomyxa filosa TaxID=46433 RepID=X6NW97_RETFI|nr:hypothetical protein RFI_07574 [Reticulomyxa filosa]|eukprot:ETO29547.1 hypothetical protein RFI_07574 [Reticulomyxa filosa]